MANTYTQIHLQIVCVVKYRAALIHQSWKHELYKYITTIIKNAGHKPIIINGMPDHIHILIGMRPTQSLSDLMKTVKGDSAVWINSRKLVQGRFKWQEGYAAFSYSKSHVQNVINYIKNQEEHHRRKSLIEEYKKFLRDFDVDYQEQYIFTEPE